MIRYVTFERIFKSRFDAAADKALSTSVRGALAEGCTYGVANGLTYLAKALLFYIGPFSSPMASTHTSKRSKCLTRLCSLTIGSQLMAFST